jgi:hypothetical protein
MSYRFAGAQDPIVNAQQVTPSDSGSIPETRALWVGVGGNIKVTFINASTPITFTGVLDGTLLPFKVTRVWNDQTSAGDIIALY